MFKCMKELLEAFPSHQFRANWQDEQLKNLVANLPLGHVCTIHEYSENYSCLQQDQLQTSYFSQVQASIHVTVLHQHAVLQTDGDESSEKNPLIITEHIFVVSPDCKNDNHAVHQVRQLISGYLKEIGL